MLLPRVDALPAGGHSGKDYFSMRNKFGLISNIRRSLLFIGLP